VFLSSIIASRFVRMAITIAVLMSFGKYWPIKSEFRVKCDCRLKKYMETGT
jgi:hypothetical protein